MEWAPSGDPGKLSLGHTQQIGHQVLEGPSLAYPPSFVMHVSYLGAFQKINKGCMKTLIFWVSFETAQKSPSPV